MWHYDPLHLGVSADSTIGAGNAGGLGLDWAVNTGASSYTSPVVYHSPTLNKTLVYAANQLGSRRKVTEICPSIGVAARTWRRSASSSSVAKWMSYVFAANMVGALEV